MPRLLALFAAGMFVACAAQPPPEARLTVGAERSPVGVAVTLDATASSDASGAALVHQWRVVARPPGSTAQLATPDAPATYLRPDVEGRYEVAVVVSNGKLTAEARGSFEAACNVAPPRIAFGAPPSSNRVGAPVSFSATVTDSDEVAPCSIPQDVQLFWTMRALPAGSKARLSGERGSSPWFVPDAPGTYRAELVATDVTGRSSRAEIEATVGACGTRPPVVTEIGVTPAAVGRVVLARATVSDPDIEESCEGADSLRFAWRIARRPAGSSVAISLADTLGPYFTPDVAGLYVLELTVVDAAGLRAIRTVDVAADGCGANAPVVEGVAATPAAPATGQAVSLDATVSDADAACGRASTLCYAWAIVSLPAGSRARLNDASAVRPWFLADVPGSYRVGVRVTDAEGHESVSSLDLDVAACGSAAPVVEISAPESAGVGETVAFTAALSDADTESPCGLVETLVHRWTLVAKPAGSRATLGASATRVASLVPDVAGSYVVRLEGFDAAGHAAEPVLATLSVGTCGSAAPVVALSSSPGAPGVGQPVSIAASVSDADRDPPCGRTDPATLSWSLETLPAGSKATLAATQSDTSFVPDVAGDYTVVAVAIDASGREGRARSIVTVSACGAAAPSFVDATATPSTPWAGQVVELRANAVDADTQAPCGLSQQLSYRWNVVRLPTGSRAALVRAEEASAELRTDVGGTYGLRVVVSDGTGRSATRDVTVDVSACGAHAPVASVSATPAAPLVGSSVRLAASVTDADDESACTALANPPPAESFTFEWTLVRAPAGSAAALSSPGARAPEFVADLPGSYAVRLVVRDASGRASAPVEASVAVGVCGTNPPSNVVAIATPSVSVVGGRVALAVTYDDADEDCGAADTNVVSWNIASAPSSSRAVLAGAAFTPDVPGSYRLVANVRDSAGRNASGTVSVSVGSCGTNAPTSAPSVAPSSALIVGAPVNLRANSADADALAPCSKAVSLAHHWTLVAAPAGSRATFANPGLRDAAFVPDVAGNYVASLTVVDETGRASAAAQVSVAVASCGDHAPVARLQVTKPAAAVAGPATSLVVNPLLSCQMQLDARATTDADAACGLAQTPADLSYAWTQTRAPAGSTATLSSTTGANPWFSPDVGGTYEFGVTASDGLLWSEAPATVRVVHDGFTVERVAPAVACAGASTPTSLALTAGGQKFLRVNPSTLPRVTFAGAVVTVSSISGCVPSGVPGIDACTTLVITIPGSRPVGDYPIVVENPVENGCFAQNVFSVGPAPTVTGNTPVAVCAVDDPLQPDEFLLQVTGTGFVSASQVALRSAATDYAAGATTLVSSTRLDAEMPIPPPGSYGVVVSNGAACEAVRPAALNVRDLPLVYFVDPPVVYNGIGTQVTAYFTGPNGAGLTGVRIRKVGDSGFTSVPHVWTGAKPNQVQVELPRGLAPGAYETIVTDNVSCTSRPVQTFTVTNTLSVALSQIDPPFGWANEDTAVDLRITQPLPAGKSGIAEGVRVYLNPVGGTGLASGLRAVSVNSAFHASAVVRAGLAPGLYDVIVVNENGSVGLLPGGFRVTTASPPIIETITPGSVPRSTGQLVTVRGTGFNTPTVRLDCQQPDGSTPATPPAVTRLGSTGTTVDLRLDVSSLADNTLCVLVLTNPDASYAEFSALAVTSPSENLPPLTLSTKLMTVGRRAPAVAPGRPTRVARFLYAVGGDAGAATGALASVEAASLDRFGGLGDWRTLPVPLPAGRTLASAQRVGRFLYVVGGSLGATPTNTVLRAEVLDPSRAPDIDDLGVDIAPAGLQPGLWYYRIAAVLSASDAANPGGEGLPSDPLPVRVPAGYRLNVTLSWTGVPNASKYRIYRSPAANAGFGNERLLAEVTAPTTTFVDTNASTVGTAVPRRLGDLGAWASMPDMGVARASMGLGFARDPDTANKPNAWYLFAIGGRSGTGPLTSTEALAVTVDPSTGAHTVGTWVPSTSNLRSPRSQLAAFNVDRTVSNNVGLGETWIYAGPGLGASSTERDVDAARVQTGGVLSWVSSDSISNRAGYGGVAAANQLLIFGGQNGGPSNDARTATLGTPMPAFDRSWNAGSASLQVNRFLMATSVESARIFVVGGTDGTSALRSVESVLW